MATITPFLSRMMLTDCMPGAAEPAAEGGTKVNNPCQVH
jgi:hypothetical protein